MNEFFDTALGSANRSRQLNGTDNSSRNVYLFMCYRFKLHATNGNIYHRQQCNVSGCALQSSHFRQLLFDSVQSTVNILVNEKKNQRRGIQISLYIFFHPHTQTHHAQMFNLYLVVALYAEILQITEKTCIYYVDHLSLFK